MNYKVVLTKDALKDAKKISRAGLKANAENILEILAIDPLQNPPPYKKLVGSLKGSYSRRINIQHRLVYQIIEKHHIVKVLRMWSHYE